MKWQLHRRDFLKLAGLGGVVFASSLTPLGRGLRAAPAAGETADFYFVQLSDTHWGFTGPQANPDASGTLPKAIAAVNSLAIPPDFIVFTGDLTHTTDDPAERRSRLKQFQDIVKGLRVPVVRFLAGEHDASLDQGEAYQEFFGPSHYTFDHKGIHFIALDNVSDPAGQIGDTQLEWLHADLQRLDRDAPIVVLTHRPLFDLYPQWDWATADGAKAIALLLPYRHVTVFYGHIHQENHHMTEHIAHHSAKSLIFPLPAPGSVPKRAPLPWDPAHPYNGLGFREVDAQPKQADYRVTEYPVKQG